MPNLTDIFLIFLKLGCTSFGGPIAHLAYFRAEFVTKRAWLTESEYTNIVAICQAIPGPASSQVGFAIGLLKGGWLGALLAFIAFTAPSIVLLIVFASQLHWFSSEIGQAVLQGLMILAFVVVLQAIIGMANQLCKTNLQSIIALSAFVLVVCVNHPFIVLSVIAIGALVFAFMGDRTNNKRQRDTPVSRTAPCNIRRKLSIFCGTVFAVLFLVLPVIDAHYQTHTSVFYQAGALVFGGGHVVLPLLESLVVQSGLIGQSAFISGYGATQAMPGPMFAFAGYLGYFLPSEQGGIVGALVASLFIFLPGFLLVSAIMPIWQHTHKYPRIEQALAGANAAVVGLLAATLYKPIFVHGILNETHAAIAGVLFVMLVKLKLPVLVAVVTSVLLSVVSVI